MRTARYDSAVDNGYSASDVVRVAGRQENNRTCDVLWRSDPTQGHGRRPPFRIVVRNFFRVIRGLDMSWRDRVNIDAVRSQLVRHSAHELIHSGLGCRVMTVAGHAEVTLCRADRHNAAADPLRDHGASRFLHAEKGTPEV